MADFLKLFTNKAEFNSKGELYEFKYWHSIDDIELKEFVDTLLVARFDVVDTENPTKILHNTGLASYLIVDGVKVTSVTSGYTFDTVGEHTVKYKLKRANTLIEYGFNDCVRMKYIKIPNGVITISKGLLNGCTNLTDFIMPNTITKINQGVLRNCTSLKSFKLSDNLRTLENNAFHGPCGITAITFPSTVTTMGNNTVRSCGSLKAVIMLPTTPPPIGSDSFLYNASGRKIYVPDESVELYKTYSTAWQRYANNIYPMSQLPREYKKGSY